MVIICMVPHLAFDMELGIQTQVFRLAWQAVYGNHVLIFSALLLPTVFGFVFGDKTSCSSD